MAPVKCLIRTEYKQLQTRTEQEGASVAFEYGIGPSRIANLMFSVKCMMLTDPSQTHAYGAPFTHTLANNLLEQSRRHELQ